MNYLAHIYLSFDDPQVEIGNFIADSLRAKQLTEFDEKIQKGVKMHWKIDEFTDSHSVVKESKSLLYHKYGKYSAVLVDIYYDHYLAKNWSNYHDLPLDRFVVNFYNLLEKNVAILPLKVQQMLPYMKRYNWLYNYQFFEGMENVLYGMSKRASFESKMEQGVEDLKLHYDAFEAHFDRFFPDLIDMAKAYK